MRLFKLIKDAKQVQDDNIERLPTLAHDFLRDTHPELFALTAGLDPHIEPDKSACYWGPKGVVSWEIKRDPTAEERAIARIRVHVDTQRSYADFATPYPRGSWEHLHGDFTPENIGRALAIASDRLDEWGAKKNATSEAGSAN